MMQSTKLLPMTVALPLLFLYVLLVVSMIKMFLKRKSYDLAYYPETNIIEKELITEYDDE